MAFNNKSHEEGEKLVVVLDRNTVSSNKVISCLHLPNYLFSRGMQSNNNPKKKFIFILTFFHPAKSTEKYQSLNKKNPNPIHCLYENK